MKILHKIAKFRTQILLFTVAILIMAVSVNLYTKKYCHIEKNLNLCEKEIFISGIISSYPVTSEKTVSIQVIPQESDCDFLIGEKIYVTITDCEDKKTGFGYKDKVVFSTKLTSQNSTSNPGAFNYDEYLFSQGIVASGYVKCENIMVTPAKDSLAASIYNIRNRFTDNAKKYISKDNAGLVTAIVSGNRSGISADDSAALKMSGIYHIVAISGLHLNLFIFMVTYFIAKLKIKRIKKAILTLMATIAVGGFVLVFTGFGLSVYRALIMMTILSVSSVISRDYSAKNSLFISGFVIVTFMPYSLWNTGFLLSFLSTLSVLVSIDVINLAKNHKSLQKLSENYAFNTALISVMSILFTLPVTVVSFGYITTYSWLTNLLVLPVVPYFLGGSVVFAAISAMGFDSLSQILGYVLESISEYILYVARFVSSLPASTPEINVITISVILIFITFYALTMYTAMKKGLKKAFLIILIFAVAGGSFLRYNDKNETIQITYCDVRQGECTLIELGESAVMIDCGTNDNSATTMADAVSDIVRTRGIDEIDMLIVTHFHNDHTNMIPEFSKLCKINNLLIPKYFDKSESEAMQNYRMILETAIKHHINVRYVSRGTSVDFSNNAKLEFMSPSPDMFFENNDMSSVIKLSFGQKTFLFCGDIQTAGIENLKSKDVKCDILKVPHHGGYCDALDSFVESAGCETAIISCGKNNSYGHPKPETLEVLKKTHCKIYCTSSDGAITVCADKNRITDIKTMK
ncbi:MAG: DNA internalization-related competence protein ComEC/Rec2 [Clostridia bacterium]|nr:DNA internalization-related competence protein ComEC/Rec2 [Clostridia bacterium]